MKASEEIIADPATKHGRDRGCGRDGQSTDDKNEKRAGNKKDAPKQDDTGSKKNSNKNNIPSNDNNNDKNIKTNKRGKKEGGNNNNNNNKSTIPNNKKKGSKLGSLKNEALVSKESQAVNNQQHSGNSTSNKHEKNNKKGKKDFQDKEKARNTNDTKKENALNETKSNHQHSGNSNSNKHKKNNKKGKKDFQDKEKTRNTDDTKEENTLNETKSNHQHSGNSNISNSNNSNKHKKNMNKKGNKDFQNNEKTRNTDDNKEGNTMNETTSNHQHCGNSNSNSNKFKMNKKGKKDFQDKEKTYNTDDSKEGNTLNETKINVKHKNNSNNRNKVSKPNIPPNRSQQTNDINYRRGQTIEILHVGEKPSIAEAIAKGLCQGERTINKKVMPVHVFTNPSFPKAPHAKKVIHKVTSVAGHVFSVDFPTEYQSWESVDPAELFHAPVKRKPCKGSIVSHLQNEAKGVDFIVLWMDCDREGENINFEVLSCCQHLMRGGSYDRVYRAHFSAINESDILKAYNSLGKPDKNQAAAVDARQELDLKIGVGRYGDLDSSVLSYGPCQTPTMGFCVQRHISIETFKSEPYWVVELNILKRGRRLRGLWESGRSFNKTKTEILVQKAVEANSVAIVNNVVTKDKKQGRPTPLKTVALLKACSSALGIGPHQAMQSAERLYLSGYLSYPRTESTAYPKSFDIKGTLQQQTGDSRWGSYVRDLIAQGHNKPRGGVDMGDHPPITPMRPASPYELSGDMSRVYELVVRHFIASVSPNAVWRSTKVTFDVEALGDKGKFYLAGKELVSAGFLQILLHKEYGDDADKNDDGEEEEEERSIPEFKTQEEIQIFNTSNGSSSSYSKVNVVSASPTWSSLDVKEKMTTPPGYLTESELIGMMEKHGIGTDASIPTHIENIQKRNYVRLESGRRLIPNKLGLVLVQGYHQIDSGLVLPKVRADIEGQCDRISVGELHKDVVVERAIKVFEEKFHYFVKNISRMDVLFGSSFSKLEDVGKPFTRCGRTRRYLQYIPGPPPRLYNKFTETVYPLPVGGQIKQWSGRKCVVEGCEFELCLYSVGSPPRTFPLCPNCFNSADWALEEPRNDEDKDDMNKEMQIKRMAGKKLTLTCPLPDHHPLIDELYVSPDPDSNGIFTMDPHFGPKWKLVSTRDATIIHLPKSIDAITILNEKDNVFGCRKLKIMFKDGMSPLDGGAAQYSAYFPTDKFLQDSSRVYHGSERTASNGRGYGRGRGRGGGGRGRRR